VIREVAGPSVIVQTPNGNKLTFKMSDVEVVDS